MLLRYKAFRTSNVITLVSCFPRRHIQIVLRYVNSHLVLVFGFWVLGFGFWVLVFGFWFLVFGFWF